MDLEKNENKDKETLQNFMVRMIKAHFCLEVKMGLSLAFLFCMMEAE